MILLATQRRSAKVRVHSDDVNIVDDDFSGNPTRLTQIDTLLYVVDASLDTLVHKFDIKNGIYIGLGISKGNGPNELLSVGTGWLYCKF